MKKLYFSPLLVIFTSDLAPIYLSTSLNDDGHPGKGGHNGWYKPNNPHNPHQQNNNPFGKESPFSS